MQGIRSTFPLAALVCGLLAGSIHVYPDLRFRSELGPSYQGVPLMGATDEAFFLARVKRVSLGDWGLGNAALYEHRDDPWIHGPAGELLEGYVARLFGLSAGDVDVVFTFVLPAILAVVAYGFFMTVTQSAAFSVLGTMTVMFGQYLISKDSPLLHLSLTQAAWTWPLQFVRPISPQFYYLPLLVAIWAFYHVFAGRHRWAWLGGLCLGVQFYTSMFLWTFLLTGLGLLFFLSIAQRRAAVAKEFVIAAAIGIVCAIPYGYNLWLTTSHVNYAETFVRMGGFFTRMPILPLAHLAAAAAFIVAAWRWRHERWYQFIATFMAAGFVCLNQQLITGRTVQPFHWETQTNKLVLEIGLVVVAWRLVHAASRRFVPLLTAVVCGAGTVVLVLHGWALQTNYVEKKGPEFAALQPLARPLAWLSQHTEPSDVVLVHPQNFEWAEYVTAVTGNHTYIADLSAHPSLLSREEIERRHLSALRFFGATSEEARAFIRWYNGAHFLGIAALPWQVPINQTAIATYWDDLQLRYDRRDPTFSDEALTAYKLDYVLMTTAQQAKISAGGASSSGLQFSTVYEDEAFVIWRANSVNGRGELQNINE